MNESLVRFDMQVAFHRSAPLFPTEPFFMPRSWKSFDALSQIRLDYEMPPLTVPHSKGTSHMRL